MIAASASSFELKEPRFIKNPAVVLKDAGNPIDEEDEEEDEEVEEDEEEEEEGEEGEGEEIEEEEEEAEEAGEECAAIVVIDLSRLISKCRWM